MSGSVLQTRRHLLKSSIANQATLTPLIFLVILPKMELDGSGEGPMATFLLVGPILPGIGSLVVRFVLARLQQVGHPVLKTGHPVQKRLGKVVVVSGVVLLMTTALSTRS